MEDVEQSIRDFIVQNFLFGDVSRLPAREDSLVELGIIDSTGILEVIEFLEGDIGVQVDDAETLPENLGSVANLVDFVGRKQSAN